MLHHAKPIGTSMGNPWDPEQYQRFQKERSAPFADLLALVRRRPAMRVVDLGCGTGELTRLLHDSLGASDTLGIDSSAEMLAKAGGFTGLGLRFARADIAEYRADGEVDLLFSNAALHWLPDHAALLPRLARALRKGGQIAVQVPANFDQPGHVTAAEVASEEPFRSALGGYTGPGSVLAPEEYARLLDGHGFREQHVRLQVYGHHLGGREDVVEWVKGTLLTDYRGRMPAELFERFLDRYREKLLPRLEDRRPFFFPFKRILMWGGL